MDVVILRVASLAVVSPGVIQEVLRDDISLVRDALDGAATRWPFIFESALLMLMTVAWQREWDQLEWPHVARISEDDGLGSAICHLRCAFRPHSNLIVRNTLKEIDPDWEKCSHKDIPEILKTSICKRAKKQAQKLLKNGQSDAQSTVHSIISSANELAETLKTAYEIRCIADYSPDLYAVISDNDIQLSMCTTKRAQHWPKLAERNTGIIQSNWRRLGF